MRLDNHARPVLNAGDSQSLSLHAVCPAPAVPDGDGVATVRAVIIPAPGADGVVPTRGGRTHRMSSPARLAAALNAQEVDVRIDFDHGTEDVAKTFAGTTEAKGGWLSDFRAEVNGAISAALALSADGADKLRRKLYKYMSPGLYLGRRGEIVAMSSLALLNNPNMDLPAPALNADGDADDEEAALKKREDALKKREEAANERDLNAATAAVDRAVEDERLLPAQREFMLNAIQAHADGIVAGIAAFEAAHPAETAEVDTNALQQRIAPAGAPKKKAGAAPAFRMPAGSQAQQPTDESLQLHARVLEHAQAGGKAYRDSVVELAAQGLSAPDLNAAPDGAQLATAQARVIDPVLTTAARGYRNAEHVHKALFPRVETGVRGGTRVEFDRTDFRRSNSSRAPGAKTRRVQFGHDGVKFALAQHRLEGKLPVENAEEAIRVPGIDLGMRTVDGTLALISLEREIHAAELVADQANYPAAHVNALAGGSKWDAAGSAPTTDVAAGIEQVRSAIGRRPKTVLMGPSVFDIVSRHDTVLNNLRWGGERKDHATMEDLARLWNVAEVVVGDAIYVDANDETHDVWGNIVVVAYTMVGAVTRFEPSFGFGYTLSGTPMVEAPYYDRNENSWLYPCCEEWSNEIVGQDAGFLIKDVITP